MLRKRIPGLDDKSILSIVSSELLPLTRKAVPHLKFDKKMVKRRLNDGSTYVIRGRHGVVQGFITFAVRDEVLYIDMLAMRREFQGKGLGSLLMGKAEEIGRKRGCKTAMLYVDRDNERGKGFYGKLGYRQESYLDHIKCYLLRKPLQGQQYDRPPQAAGDPFPADGYPLL